MPTEAPVMTVTGLKIDEVATRASLSIVSGAAALPLAGDTLAQRDAVARGDPQQIGGAPHQVILELRDASVCQHDFPHHLDNTEAARFVERSVDQAGEVIEIDGFLL